MAKLCEDVDALQKQLQDQKEAQGILMDELSAQSGEIEILCRTNGVVVHALNRIWEILDRLTDRAPIILKMGHVHHFRKVQDATFMFQGSTLGYGVTEACTCGAIRSRMTSGISLEEYTA